MKAIVSTLVLLGVASNLFAQQVGSIDLTQAPAPTTSALPPGCKSLSSGMIADGWPVPKDNQPREIAVEIIKLSDDKLVPGSAVQAEVRLRNDGSQPIEIPWSPDPSTIQRGQAPDHLQWHAGWFEAWIQRQGVRGPLLESLTYNLYGSKFSPGTLLTIRSGEWVTAKIRFMLESDFAISGRQILEGPWQLTVNWQQDYVYENVGPAPVCSAGRMYSHYDRYYRQTNPPTTIKVSSSVPEPH